MALQTSGAISISDIKAELGSSSNNLIALASEAGISPAAMSNFYGFEKKVEPTFTPSTTYWQGDGVNDTLRFEGQEFGYDTTQPLTWSGWYRIDSSGGAVEQLGSLSPAVRSGSNQVFLQYDGRNNRIYHRYRMNGTFCQRQYPLHDNISITGVSSSGWKSSNRGNTNSNGFAHLVFTWNPSDTTFNAIQVYWNGQRLTSSVNNQSGTRGSNWSAGSGAIADLVSSYPNNANVFQGAVDNVAIWRRVLSESEINTMYNGGQPIQFDEAGVTADIMGEYRLEGDGSNFAGDMPRLENINGGRFNRY